jgi:hypothetical protein
MIADAHDIGYFVSFENYVRKIYMYAMGRFEPGNTRLVAQRASSHSKGNCLDLN